MNKQFVLMLMGLLTFGYAQSQTVLGPAEAVIFQNIINEFSHKYQLKPTKIINAKTGAVRYRPRYLSSQTFDTLFQPIFGKVMLGSEDLVNQGSAYALTVNQFESKFSLNYNGQNDKKNKKGAYLNAGFSASSSTKFFQMFAKDQWQQGMSLSFGYTKPFNRSLFYNVDSADYFQKKHRAVALELKEVYEAFLEEKQLRQSLRQVDSLSLLLHQNDSVYITQEDNYFKKIAALHFKSKSEVQQAEKTLQRVDYLRKADSMNMLGKYVDSSITSFESGFFTKVNYKFSWINILLRPEYKGISIYDTLAAKMTGIEKKHYFRLGMEFYFNQASSRKNLFIRTYSLGIKNSNALEGKKPDQIAFLQRAINDSVVITKSGEGVVVEDYAIYRKQFLLMTPGVGFNLFWNESRRFGWEAYLSAKIGLRSKQIPFDDVFTFRTGLLFSINGKTDLAKSTFGLIAQWEDVQINRAHIRDGFTLSVRIGIPFNY